MKAMAESSQTILILGAGRFGTCLAQHLAQLGHSVTVWSHHDAVVTNINQDHQNQRYCPDQNLHPSIRASHQLTPALLLKHSVIINAVPVQGHRKLLEKISQSLSVDHLYISVSKGIEKHSGLLPGELLQTFVSQQIANNAVVLFGPSFSEEIMENQPTAIVAASRNQQATQHTQALFHSPSLRIYTSADPMGLEVAGALKNVIAIASGACAGLGFKNNAQAALITRGLKEMINIGIAKGANPITFLGLGGIGDLFLTCHSKKSRNFQVGYFLGEGLPLNETLARIGSVAEGVTTAAALATWLKDMDLDCPIIQTVHDILFGNLKVNEAVTALLNRPSTMEFDLTALQATAHRSQII